MRKILFIILGVITLANRCSSPESVAEKALHEIGNGLYLSGVLGSNHSLFSLNDALFTKCYANTRLGEEFTKYEGVGSMGSLSDLQLLELCFDTDYLFDSVKLVEKEDSRMDIYAYHRRLTGDETMLELDKQLERIYSKEWKYFKCNDYIMAGLQYENIPCYMMKYKLDNKYIADVIVLKIPKEGWRVASVSIK